MSKSTENSLSVMMKLYVAKAITNTGREIKCEECGTYKNLEFHHTKYDGATIHDIQILCCKCHRNDSHKASFLKTLFKKSKRFCWVCGFQFAY